MANLVVHFEIHASEPQRLIDFYAELLGWRFTQFGDMPYWSIDTGEGSIGMDAPGRGINGGLTQRQGRHPERGAPVNGAIVVVGVEARRRACSPRGWSSAAPRRSRSKTCRDRPRRLPARPGRQRLRADLAGALRRHPSDVRSVVVLIRQAILCQFWQ